MLVTLFSPSIFSRFVIKWTKTIQARDKVHLLTLPRSRGSRLCPYTACRQALRLYTPGENDPLFQYKIGSTWVVLTDTRIRKFLSKINTNLGFPRNYFTFPAFRRSGATLAYKSQVSVQHIKDHGSWTSDCVWTYIQKDHTAGENIASTFAKLL